MIVATAKSVFRVDRSAEAVLLHSGRPVDQVAVSEAVVLALLAGGEAFVCRGDDSDAFCATGIRERIESLLITQDAPLVFLAGTTGGQLYRCELHGGELRRATLCSFEDLDCRSGWYAPRGGETSVRALAATTDGCVYAGIHVGSMMRSPDAGRSWEPVTPGLNDDVHQVVVCPVAPRNVYANTAHAVFVSENRGCSWRHCGDGLGHRYGRAIAVSPVDPRCLLCSVSDGPDGEDVQGQLYRSHDGGDTWEHVTAGFPASTRRNIDTFHVIFEGKRAAWAAVGPDLYRSRDRGISWECVRRFGEPIRALVA